MSPLLAPDNSERQTSRRSADSPQRAPSPPTPATSPTSAGRTRTPRAQHHALSSTPLVGPDQLFALSHDALIVVDAATLRICAWNPRAESLFGYTATSAVDRSIDLIMPPDLGRLYHQRLAHFARTGDPTVLHSRSDLVSECRGQDNRPRSVTVSVDDLPPSLPSRPHLVLFTIRETLPTLDAHAVQTASAGDAETRTAVENNPCHDALGVDAATVRRHVHRAQRTAAHLGRALDEKRLSPASVACLSRVMEARLATIDRSLAAREDLGKIHVDPPSGSAQRINLVPLFASLVAEFRSATGATTGAPGGGTGFRLNLAMPQGFTIQADPERIAYVIRFLLADARRRNPRGCWIDVDLRRPLGGLAHIGVRDYGRALSQREEARLPNRPTTDDDWLLVHGIVMRMGGTIACDLPAEGGLRVGIDLPVNGIRSRPRDAR